MENFLEAEVEINGDSYTLELSYEPALEIPFQPYMDIEIHRVIVWDGEKDTEVDFEELPTELREQLEDVARYQAERSID